MKSEKFYSKLTCKTCRQHDHQIDENLILTLFSPWDFFPSIKIRFLNDNTEKQESHSMVVPRPFLLCIVKYSYMYSQ